MIQQGRLALTLIILSSLINFWIAFEYGFRESMLDTTEQAGGMISHCYYEASPGSIWSIQGICVQQVPCSGPYSCLKTLCQMNKINVTLASDYTFNSLLFDYQLREQCSPEDAIIDDYRYVLGWIVISLTFLIILTSPWILHHLQYAPNYNWQRIAISVVYLPLVIFSIILLFSKLTNILRDEDIGDYGYYYRMSTIFSIVVSILIYVVSSALTGYSILVQFSKYQEIPDFRG